MSTQTNIRGTDTCPAVSELANKRCRTKPPQPLTTGFTGDQVAETVKRVRELANWFSAQ